MKNLLICRHAKSSWQDATLSDVERPLNKRGEKDAPEMGRRLALRGFQPDLLISSHAVRARTTAEYLADPLGYPRDRLQVVPLLYAATAPALLAFVRGLDDEATRVMLVGHNPESTAFANWLGHLDITNIPTCGMVSLELPVTSWTRVEPGSGRLLFFDYPKNTGG